MHSHNYTRNRVDDVREAYSLAGEQSSPEMARFISEICESFVPLVILRASQTGLCSSRNPNHLNLLIVVIDRPDGLMRWKIDQVTADLHISNIVKLRADLRLGGDHENIRFYGSARLIHGDAAIARELVATATDRLSKSPAKQSGDALFKSRTEPFDLLASYQAIRDRNPQGARLILAKLIHSCIDAFLMRNTMWKPNIGIAQLVIRERDPECADILESILNASSDEILKRPELIENFVTSFAGEPQVNRVIATAP